MKKKLTDIVLQVYFFIHFPEEYHFFDLKGKSQTIDTACSSSFSALDNAVKDLYHGYADYSLVAGVNLNLNPMRDVMCLRNRMLSEEGRCKAFDASADGFVTGDGVACILLQPLEDAVRSNNHIYGVIKGINTVHGGRAVSLTAPDVKAQSRAISGAYEQTDISADSVNYIETHGSGTSLGDPIEIEALTHSYKTMTDKKQFCYIGSVKSNIGHLESASGIIGLIKVLMMMKYHQIPPTLHVNTPNPLIDLKHSPFIIADKLIRWEPVYENTPLRAGISCFGLTGVSVHVLLEEYTVKPHFTDNSAQIFLLSAKNRESLNEMIDEWKEYINTEEFADCELSDICKTLAVGREHFPFRTGRIISNKTELSDFICNYAAKEITECSQSDFSLRIGDMTYDNALQLYDICMNNKLSKEDMPPKTDIAPSSSAQFTIKVQYALLLMMKKAGVKFCDIHSRDTGNITALMQTECIEVDLNKITSDDICNLPIRNTPMFPVFLRTRVRCFSPITSPQNI